MAVGLAVFVQVVLWYLTSFFREPFPREYFMIRMMIATVPAGLLFCLAIIASLESRTLQAMQRRPLSGWQYWWNIQLSWIDRLPLWSLFVLPFAIAAMLCDASPAMIAGRLARVVLGLHVFATLFAAYGLMSATIPLMDARLQFAFEVLHESGSIIVFLLSLVLCVLPNPLWILAGTILAMLVFLAAVWMRDG